MAAWKARTVAVALALAALIVTTGAAFAQWPTTCVDLNDIVEAHLGNHGNVGIYQRAYGSQAEGACQLDHRDDVRSVFGWALGTAATVQETSDTYRWEVVEDVDPVTGRVTYRARHFREWWYDPRVPIQTNTGLRVHYSQTQGLLVAIARPIDGMLALLNDTFRVEYRFDDHPHRTEYWSARYSGYQWPRLYGQRAARFLDQVLRSSTLNLRVTGWNEVSSIEATFDNSFAASEPLRDVLRKAGYVPPPAQEWPTTCVQLNDVVEAHLGNHQNVGIYQRAFGAGAESGCQADHRADVLAVFWWAQ